MLTTLVMQLCVPLAINLIASFIVHLFLSKSRGVASRGERARIRGVLVIGFALVTGCLVYGYLAARARLVIVPDLRGQWRDQAQTLCRDYGLECEVTKVLWGHEPNRIARQTRAPGEVVNVGCHVDLTVWMGPPVPPGQQMYAIPSDTATSSEDGKERADE